MVFVSPKEPFEHRVTQLVPYKKRGLEQDWQVVAVVMQVLHLVLQAVQIPELSL